MDTETKLADVGHEVIELIRRRWSPRAFALRPVEEEKLKRVLEAARWAPSAGNEQPWRFIVARKQHPHAYAKLLACLKEKNQTWAKGAPVLIMTFAKRHFRDDSERNNRTAQHDVGLATAHLILQATALNLYVHPMAGFLPDKARATYGVPEAFEPMAVLAVGYLGDASGLPDDLHAREHAPRKRHPLDALVFEEAWEQPARFLNEP